MTALSGDTNITTLTITTPLIEGVLVSDEQRNEVYLPLTSTLVLKRKQELLHVPLDFYNNLTVDALLDFRVYVSAISQNDLDTIKQKAPSFFLKIDDSPKFYIQGANGKLQKSLATATPKFENVGNLFAEHFVVMKKLIGPIVGLPFMRNNSVVLDTTHGLIHFSHVTM